MKNTVGRIFGLAVLTAFVVAFVGFMAFHVVGTEALEADHVVLGSLSLSDAIFYALALMTVAGAAGVAFSRNILYTAIGLLFSLLGAGALYVLLSADFLAVTQLLVYIGGVLVLMLFAVMLTNRITEVNVSNTSFGVFGGALLFVAVAPLLVFIAARTPWAETTPVTMETTAAVGNAFLTKWLLPFELASLVLLATLIGAVVIARKEIKAD